MTANILDTSDIDQYLGKPVDSSTLREPITTNDIRRWVHAMHYANLLHYDSTYTLIPAVAISTLAAEKLSRVLKEEGKATVSIKMNCRTLPDAPSFNDIGEIRGSERPGDVIVVGGHLDSWDAGHGAHDDGAGCNCCTGSADRSESFARRQGAGGRRAHAG